MDTDPARADIFFDRDEELALVQKRVDGLKEGYRYNIAFLGPELIGKTSLLLHLPTRLSLKTETIFVYFEIREESVSAFVNRFIRALFYYCLKGTGQKAEVTDGMQELLEKGRLQFPETVELALRIEKMIGRRGKEHIFSSVFDLIPIAQKESGKCCVMMLDEFHRFNGLGIKSPFAIFGQKIATHIGIVYIVTSSLSHKGVDILSNELSLLFGSFEVNYLKTFPPKRAIEFIGGRVGSLSLSRAHREFLVYVTSGHPLYLEGLCRSLSEDTPNGLCNAITEQFFDADSLIYQHFLNLCKSVDEHERAILILMANGAKKSEDVSRAMGKSTAYAARKLERLAASDILLKCGKVYVFRDLSYKFWLNNVYTLRESSLTADISVMSDVFQKRVGAILSSFQNERKKDILVRVRQLISSFRNEVVELNGRAMKLPKFTSLEGKVIRGIEVPVVACFGKKCWVISLEEKMVTESVIREFAEKTEKIRGSLAKRVLICLDGIEDDARLLAHEQNVSLWFLTEINFLLDLYGQFGIIR